MSYAPSDRLSGVEGIVSIDLTPGTAGGDVTLDVVEWNYREFGDIIRGRTMGNRATGRTFLGADWELNVRCRIRSSVTATDFFRRGLSTGFSVQTDESPTTPALKVVGAGMLTEAGIGVPVDDYIEYRLRIGSDDPDELNLPVISLA